jgi:hypothetical protein
MLIPYWTTAEPIRLSANPEDEDYETVYDGNDDHP